MLCFQRDKYVPTSRSSFGIVRRAKLRGDAGRGDVTGKGFGRLPWLSVVTELSPLVVFDSRSSSLQPKRGPV